MGRKKVPSNRHGHMIKMAVMHNRNPISESIDGIP